MEENACTQSIIPDLTVKDAARAIEFYKKAFGAEEVMRLSDPGGQGIMHAELKIGNSVIFLSDEYPEMNTRSPQTLGGATGGIYISVEDVDSVFKKAVKAGAQVEMEVENMFWGDRMGSVIDPFGHHWSIATHKEDVSDEELKRRMDEFYAQMAAKKESDIRTSV